MAETMDRRKFLSLAASSVAVVGAFIGLQGCSSGSSSSTTTTPEPTTTSTDKSGAVSSNHGHSATLTAAQQQARMDVMIYLSSGSGHTHQLWLTAADVATVAAGTRWSKETSTDSGHSHVVTFN